MKRFLILAAMVCGLATVGSSTSEAGWRYRGGYYGGPVYGGYYGGGYGYYPYRSYYGGGYYPYRSYYSRGWGGGYYGGGGVNFGGRRGGVWIGF
jgi:hypothetical protein